MDCAEANNLVHLYLDQELDLLRTLDVENHLRSCPSCRAQYDRQRALRSNVRRDAIYHRAPSALRQRLGVTLRAEAEGAPAPAARPRTWWSAGIAIAAVVVLGVSAALYLATPIPQNRLIDDVVSSHVRSLMANHLSDVASSDQHTVKPWFDGKLDYSPPVDDLTGQGFPLIGGRLDYLDGRPVAALVYRHRLHVINLFVWPSEAGHDQEPRALSRQGYNLMHWKQGGMEFWAISDLNEAELRKFADDVSAMNSPR